MNNGSGDEFAKHEAVGTGQGASGLDAGEVTGASAWTAAAFERIVSHSCFTVEIFLRDWKFVTSATTDAVCDRTIYFLERTLKTIRTAVERDAAPEV